MRIGIITFHWASNYGAILQAYALQSYLEEQGHQVEIINYKPASRDFNFANFLRSPRQWLHLVKYNQKKHKESLLVPFREKYLHQTQRFYDQESLNEVSSRYDAIISGSDQVLNPSFVLYGDKKPASAYFLSFALPETLKIGYAVSFGCNVYPENAGKFAKEWIKNFDSIGVRETSGKAIVDQLGYTTPATLVPDPVVLWGKNVFSRLQVSKAYLESYICVYALRRELQLPKGKNYRIIDDVHSPVNLEEWISLIAGSEMLVTNSFHGMVVALLNHVPFAIEISGGRNKGMNDRFYTLLDRLGLIERICGEQYSLTELLNNHDINWESVDAALKQVQKEGAVYLNDALGKS